MNTTQLIAKLKKLENEHGVLPVRIEAVATGLDYMDEGGNIIETHTVSASARKCMKDKVSDGSVAVWIVGTAS